MIDCVVAARAIANPNFGFQQQLQDWCESERWQCVELMKRLPPVPYKDDERIAKLVCEGNEAEI